MSNHIHHGQQGFKHTALYGRLATLIRLLAVNGTNSFPSRRRLIKFFGRLGDSDFDII